MKFFSLIVTVSALAGCVSSAPPPRPLDLPFTKVYPGTFDLVWSATTQVLDIYSIVKIDRDAGLIETDWAEARYNSSLYEHPDKEEYLESVKFRIKLKLSKGLVAQTGEPAVRVQVLKELSEYKNFLLDYQRVPSDEIEEKVVLYRIGQRLEISEELRRQSAGAERDAQVN